MIPAGSTTLTVFPLAMSDSLGGNFNVLDCSVNEDALVLDAAYDISFYQTDASGNPPSVVTRKNVLVTGWL